MPLLEIAAFNIEAALKAADAGANRIELCENPLEGGTTPSYGTLKLARRLLHLPVHPIIRPRGGDFTYSASEYEIMQSDIIFCRNLGFEGVVLGLLTPDGMIDLDQTARLVALAYPMDVTFHKAFDRCADPFDGLEKVINCGCTRLLTSGQQPTALLGAKLIQELVNAAENRIAIVAGGGIHSDHLELLARQTGAGEFLAAARKPISTGMVLAENRHTETLEHTGVDTTEVQKMLGILRKF